MYITNQRYFETLHDSVLRYSWEGNITTTTGNVYTFTNANLSDNGSITETASETDSLKLGAVYASELSIEFYSLMLNGSEVMAADIDRFTLYDAVIDLKCVIHTEQIYSKWSDVAGVSWDDIADMTWGDLADWIIPIGKFIVAESMRALPTIQIKAYDFLTRFDKKYASIVDRTEKTPYNWLVGWCNACNVELGMTAGEVGALNLNAMRVYGLAQVVDDLETYRDAISYLATILCAIATVDREGRLVLRSFTTAVDLDIPQDWRWDCKIADYRTIYDGLFSTYCKTETAEYTGTSAGTGLLYL